MNNSQCKWQKRLLLAACDMTFAVAMVGLAFMALTTPAYAYVDPSVMTYTIQALAGVAVALSAVLGVFWRRIRRLLFKVLKIDENAGKIVEPAVAEGFDAQADAEARAERAQQGVDKPVRLTWLPRFLIALLVSVSFFFTQVVAAPLEIVATNASAFQFSYTAVWPSLAIFAAVASVVLALVISVFKGKPFDVILGLVSVVILATLIQALFLNKGLPPTDGSPANWLSLHLDMVIASSIVWFVLLVAGLVFALKKPRLIKGTSVLVCILLALTSAVNMGVTINEHLDDFNKAARVTKEGLYTVSSSNNVIVFVLDFFDTKTLDQVLEIYPDALDSFSGFTNFHNATSMSIPTRFGIPNLVTGNFFDTTEESSEGNSVRVINMYNEHNLLDDINAQGYNVGIYSDSVDYGYKTTEAPLLEQTINIHSIQSTNVKGMGSIVKMLVQCALYRNGPWVTKPYTRYYTDDLNKAVVDQSSGDLSETPYVTNDPEYYAELQKVGLSVDSSSTGAYRFIHLMGAHSPYSMDENANYVGEREYTTTEEQIPLRASQAKGALTIVSEYLRQLKELGLYEDATIIVTADHGDYIWADFPPFTATPILLVKPSGSSEGEVVTSQAPTGHLDLPATIREAVGMEQDDPTVFEIAEDEPRTRYHYWNEQNSIGDLGFHEIAIEGDATDYNNWHATGRFWKNGELKLD